MKRNFAIVVVWGVLSQLAASASAADGTSPAPINFVDHVAPILKRHCGQCHGEAVRKSGLDLSNYQSALKGSNGGQVVVAGRPTRSRLLDLVSSDEPAERMPLGGEPLTAEQIAILKTWIHEGLREKASSVSNLPEIVDFKPTTASDTVLSSFDPARLPATARPSVLRPLPVFSLAMVPRSPFAAVASYGSIDFIDVASRQNVGSLPFAEGEPHVLRFNRAGTHLLAAGGRPVQQGTAALINIADGKRLATIGNEPDTVLAADLAPDESAVALGGSDRLVKTFSVPDGKPRLRLVKHTDWVTAVAFSPDSERLVSGDRVGNIYMWDARSGQIVFALADHKGSIRKLSWRADGKVLASCGEDGLIIWWNTENGAPMTSQADCHTRARLPGEYGKIAGGVLDVEFGPRGELASGGRDGNVRLWNPAGQPLQTFTLAGAKLSSAGRMSVVPMRVAITPDGRTILAGDSSGQVHTFQATAR